MNSKCEMAKLRYCTYGCFGDCGADEKEQERCPYLSAIGEVARLITENELNKKMTCTSCNTTFEYGATMIKRYVSKTGIIDYNYVNCPNCGRTYFVNIR